MWFVCFCAGRINLPTQNTMPTILNALSLACAESSIGSMQVGFLIALAGVWRTRFPCACQRAESTKNSDLGKTPKVLQVLFERDVIEEEEDPPNYTSN